MTPLMSITHLPNQTAPRHNSHHYKMQSQYSPMHYLKFYLFHFYAIIAIAASYAGGGWLITAFGFSVLTIVLGDIYLGSDTSEPAPKSNWLYNLQLWTALPLLILLVLAGLYQFGGWRNPNPESHPLMWLAAIYYCGLMVGTLGTITAHELVHRKWGSVSHHIGRWLLAFSFDSNFAIEHVFGHHIHIATEQDPASAPRGRNVYEHILTSTLQGNVSAWNIEKKRLHKHKISVFSGKNRFIQGVAMSMVLAVGVFALAGVLGLLFFVLTGMMAKALLEAVNYMEHYGLVRKPGKRVFPKHSWNTNAKISSWAMFNLTRHSHHHANANVPFQHLRPFPDAPMMPAGYLGTMTLSFIPPLWFKVMQPRLAAWDENFASEEELTLLKEYQTAKPLSEQLDNV